MEQNFKLDQGTSCYFELFPWDDRLNTGHELVDAQHQMLVSLVNRFDQLLISPNPKQLNRALDELFQYANQHFDDEEHYWGMYLKDDDSFVHHCQIHESFKSKIADIRADLDTHPIEEAIESLVTFLLCWLLEHLVKEDMQMAAHVKAISQGQTSDETAQAQTHASNISNDYMLDTLLGIYRHLASGRVALLRERQVQQKLRNQLVETNKKLEQQLVTDPLTELPNRRHLNQIFNQEHSRIIRDGKRLNMFIIDIDYFKLFNDTYGHLSGDEILKRVATTLKSSCSRSGDYVFRVGGEEFVVLSSSETAAQAAQFAEHLRLSIAKLKIVQASTPKLPNLSVSVGGISIHPQLHHALNEYFEAADKQMYLAKSAGRNCVKLTETVCSPKLSIVRA